MRIEAKRWLVYADENLAVALLALEGCHFNAYLQNVQQAVEKFLKAAVLEQGREFKRIHSIQMLHDQLADMGVKTALSEEDCELLDSIYLPSKYPLGSALPDFYPDEEICRQCVEIAEKVRFAIVK